VHFEIKKKVSLEGTKDFQTYFFMEKEKRKKS